MVAGGHGEHAMDDRRMAAKGAVAVGSFALGLLAWMGIAGAAEADERPLTAGRQPVVLTVPALTEPVQDAVVETDELVDEVLTPVVEVTSTAVDVAARTTAAGAAGPGDARAETAPEPAVAPMAVADVAGPAVVEVPAAATPVVPTPVVVPTDPDVPLAVAVTAPSFTAAAPAAPTVPADEGESRVPTDAVLPVRADGETSDRRHPTIDGALDVARLGAAAVVAALAARSGSHTTDLQDRSHPPRGPPSKDAP